MQTRADFNQSHHVISTYKIIKGAKAEADFQMGWGAAMSTPAVDVIDLDGDGKAGYKVLTEKGDPYNNGGEIRFTEPSIQAPELSEIERVAKERHVDVLTQDDFGQGLYLHDVGAYGKEGEGTPTSTNIRPAAQILANQKPWDPDARIAVDATAGEFIIYK